MNLDKNPKVSIITVCYNSEKYIERTIESVLAQSYSNKEYIIVDGGSKDNTLKIAGRYKDKIDVIISESDNGIFDAMNKGIKMAKGEILCFLNSDDYFYTNYITEYAVNFLLKRENLDFIHGDLVYKDPVSDKMWLYKYPRFLTKFYFLNDSIGHPATFFRVAAFKKSGCYDAQFKISSDMEWFIKALYKNRLKTMHMRRIVSVFQYGGISNDIKYRNKLLAEKEKIYKMYFSSFEVLLGKTLNFILCGNMFRALLLFIFRKKGYDFLRNLKRKKLEIKCD